MRYISAKEYQSIQAKKGESTTLSLGYIYDLMRRGKIPFVEKEVKKRIKFIPWDDEKGEVCQPELVAI